MNRFDLRMMQGRLLPRIDGRYQAFPADEWREELTQVAKLGLSGVEWILDEDTLSVNPISSPHGRDELRRICKDLNLRIDSVCADIFMTHHLVGATGELTRTSISTLERLLEWCRDLEMRYVILPFVDSSRLNSSAMVDGLRRLLEKANVWAESSAVEIHLESDLAPPMIREILAGFESPWIAMNYDIGNSSSLGFDFEDEFRHYGQRIRSVHIKDRVRGGSTVPLGEGDADVPGVLRKLVEVGYGGDLVMQIARSKDGDEFAWIQKNIEIVNDLVHQVLTGAGNT